VLPEDIVKSLLKKFEHLHAKKTWGETSLFFNPDKKSPNGSYFLTLKESDGENDKASELDREGIFRVSFGVSRTTYGNLFGPKPPRPSKGGVVQTGHDFRQTNNLMPHPIYAWMNWVQILNPSTKTWESMQELIQESYQLSKTRFENR
jgi:hypothetical protein